jgi:hypothetical protein
MSYRLLPAGKVNLAESSKLLNRDRHTVAGWLKNPDDVPYQVPLRVCFMQVSGYWWGDEADIKFWMATNGNEAAWKARCAERYAANS